MGEPRTAYGLATREGDVLTRVDVHQVVSGHVERTNSLVRQSNNDVEVTNAAGHVFQMFPLGNVVPGTGTAGAEAGVSDCSICQVVVDILYGVVACGGVAQYFYLSIRLRRVHRGSRSPDMRHRLRRSCWAVLLYQWGIAQGTRLPVLVRVGAQKGSIS